MKIKTSGTKLIIGWVLFVVLIGLLIVVFKVSGDKKDKDLTSQKVYEDEDDNPYTPYEINAYEGINNLIAAYDNVLAIGDIETIKTLVVDPTVYDNSGEIATMSTYINGYSDITCYTKKGLDENHKIVFAVASITIEGVNSTPKDIMVLNILCQTDGTYIIDNQANDDVNQYINTLKIDADINQLYVDMYNFNEELKNNDSTLADFYNMLGNQQ